jgi:hypothetical protein
MPTITAVVAQLSAVPKPVLCLDTCDILEIAQCLHYERLGAPRADGCIESTRRLLDALAEDPDRVQLVITELVATEWNQNIEIIRTKSEQHLAQVDEAAVRLYQAAGYIGTQLAAFPALSASTLVALSQALLNQAIRLDLDNTFI